MIFLLIALAIFCGSLYVQNRSFEREREEWTRERQLLLTRIQHPEFVIAAPDEAPLVSDDEIRNKELEDEIDLVGTVVPTNGSDGD